MSLTQIRHALRRLSLNQLRKLGEWLRELIKSAEEAKRTILKRRPAAETSRLAESMNSIVCPPLSTARWRYLHDFQTQDVCLVHPIGSATHLQMLTHALIDFRCVSLYQTKPGLVIYVESAFTHRLFGVAVR
jgi:hypothetical protein